MEWTEVKTQELRQLWAAGHSARVIANKLGTSRNGVLGKAFRLRLAGRKPGVRPQMPPPEPAPPAPPRTPPKLPPASNAAPGMRRLVLIDLENHHCRWPLGAMGERARFFCGAAQHPGSVYCRHHTRVAYRGERKED